MRAHQKYGYWNIKKKYLHHPEPVRSASIFNPSSRWLLSPTMATPTGSPSLTLVTNSHWYYFSRAETNNFRGHYAAVMVLYSIDPEYAATTDAPDDIVWLIYGMDQEGAPTAFLQWHPGTRGRGAQIALLRSVSNYVPRMGLPASP